MNTSSKIEEYAMKALILLGFQRFNKTKMSHIRF